MNRSGSSEAPGLPSLFYRVRSGELGPLPVLLGLLLIGLVFQTLNSHFLTPRNLSNLILQITVVGTLGAGVVLALLLGEIDLSLGAVAGVAAAILGVLVAQHGWLGLPAIIVALAAGAIMGLLQGTIIVWARVPSFIATLAGLLAWQGVQLILLGSSGELLIRNPLVRSLASGYLTPSQGAAAAMTVLLAVAVVIWRRRASRRRAGLEISPLGVAISHFAIWGLALVVGVGACNA